MTEPVLPLSDEELAAYQTEYRRLRALCKFSKNHPVAYLEGQPVWSAADQYHGRTLHVIRVSLRLKGSDAMILLGEGWDGLLLLEAGGAHVDTAAYTQLLTFHAEMEPRLFATFKAAGWDRGLVAP